MTDENVTESPRDILDAQDMRPYEIAFTGLERRLAEDYIMLLRRSARYSAAVIATSESQITKAIDDIKGEG